MSRIIASIIFKAWGGFGLLLRPWPKYSATVPKRNITPISYISSLYLFRPPYRFPRNVLHWGPRRAWWLRYLQCGIRLGVIIGEFPACECWECCMAKAVGSGGAQKACAGGGPGGRRRRLWAAPTRPRPSIRYSLLFHMKRKVEMHKATRSESFHRA